MRGPTIRAPRYLGRFRCLGAACEDSCCSGWSRIDVDGSTAETYRRLTVEGDRRVWRLGLVGSIVPIPDGMPDHDERSAQIALKADRSCPFLSHARRCTIRNSLGEALTPSVCDTYPRRASQVGGQIDLAGSFSCPEMARLALFGEDALTIETVEADRRVVERADSWINRPWTDEPAEDDVRGHYHLVRARSAALLQHREHTLAVRMLALGEVLGALDGVEARAADIEAAFDRGERRLSTVAGWLADSGIGTAAVQARPHLLLLRRLRRWITMPDDVLRHRRAKDRVRRGLGLPDDPTWRLDESLAEKIGVAYAAARARYLEPYLAHRPHLLERFALNQLWLSSFPYHRERTFAEEHAVLAFRIGLLQLQLGGVAAAEGTLTDDLVAETVQTFAKYVAGDRFWGWTTKMLRAARAVSGPSLARLLLP